MDALKPLRRTLAIIASFPAIIKSSKLGVEVD